MESNKAKRAKPPMPTADHDGGGGGGVDLISGLSDDVLVRILRLVGDARQVARTAALSRRWRGLWAHAPVLLFDSGPRFVSPRAAKRFAASVTGALAARARSSDSAIEQLGISLDACYERGKPRLAPPAAGAVEGWIRYAVQHAVTSFSFAVRALQEEKLEDDDEDDSGDGSKETVISLGDLPSSTKLETMRLFLGGAIARLASTVVFTSLRDLALECLEIASDSGEFFSRLLSTACCPRLQKLRLWSVRFNHARTKELLIEAGALLELTVYSIEMKSLELRTPNLLHLKIESCHELEAITVSAPRVKELTFSRNRLGIGIHGDLMPCVRRLGISLCSHAYKSFYDDGSNDTTINDTGISLLKQCSSATCLLVDLDIPWVMTYCVDAIKDKMRQQLPNVTSLAVKPHPMTGRHSLGNGLACLLTRFNNLEHLSLQLGDEMSGRIRRDDTHTKDAGGELAHSICDHEDNWTSNKISLPKLREAEFRGLTGTGCELRFLRFVLASAADLEKVTVSFCMNYKLEGRIDDFLHGLLGDGTWTACKDKSYEWEAVSINCISV